MRTYLILSCVSWLGYGLYCLAFPDTITTLAGVAATSATATVELRAMYGGLQAAVGVIALAGLLLPTRLPDALFALATLYTGLFLGRLVGVLASGELSPYSLLGLAFEGVFAAWGWALTLPLRRTSTAA